MLNYLLICNMAAFSLYGLDKALARNAMSRISEFVLLSSAAVVGWFGGLCAMVLFRHKTRKTSFLVLFGCAAGLHMLGLYLWHRMMNSEYE